MRAEHANICLCQHCGHIGDQYHYTLSRAVADAVKSARASSLLAFLIELAKTEEAEGAFAAHGIDPERFSRELNRALQSSAASGSGSLRTILSEACQIAGRRMAKAADADDVLIAILQSRALEQDIELVKTLARQSGDAQPTTSETVHQVLSLEALSQELEDTRRRADHLAAQMTLLLQQEQTARTIAVTVHERRTSEHDAALQDEHRAIVRTAFGAGPMFALASLSNAPATTGQRTVARALQGKVCSGFPERSATKQRSRVGPRFDLNQNDPSGTQRATAEQERASHSEGFSSRLRTRQLSYRTFRTRRNEADRGSFTHHNDGFGERRLHQHEHERSYIAYARPEREREPRDGRNSRDTRETGRETGRDTGRAARTNEPRFYLAMDDDIVDAPSIGLKTADRLRRAGILSVRDLLEADANALARAINARHISSAIVEAWQNQARLVITIPFLRGTHAQMLVGAGFATAEAIANADSGSFSAAILTFASSREGQSVLRNGPPPDLEKIAGWAKNATQADHARAA